jgi:hypothetical protein
VGDVRRARATRPPSALRPAVEQRARVSADLREDRAAAFGGDEAAGRTPEDLSGEAEAGRPAEDATLVVEPVARVRPARDGPRGGVPEGRRALAVRRPARLVSLLGVEASLACALACLAA